MIYNFETYYFTDKIDLQRTINITANYILGFCEHYKAEIVLCDKAYRGKVKRIGQLTKARVFEVIDALREFYHNNPKNPLVFKMQFSSLESQLQSRESSGVSSSDDNYWALTLSNEQFKILQPLWTNAELGC